MYLVLYVAIAEPLPTARVEEDMPRLKPILTVDEVPTLLRVTGATVRNYIRSGDLPACTSVRPYQIRREDYSSFRRDVWPLLGSGRHGHPPKGKGRVEVTPDMLELVFGLRKLTRR